MIFAHIILGTLPIDHGAFSIPWFLGSVAPDIDHLFVLATHRIYRPKDAFKAMQFEDEYNFRFKTPYVHSLFGALVLSSPLFFLDMRAGLFFLSSYLLHLLLDWPDSDEKQFFWPIPIKMRGFLPIFSAFEKGFTLALFGAVVFSWFVVG